MSPRRCNRTSGRVVATAPATPGPPVVASVRDLPRSEPFVPFSIADEEMKYVRFADGQLVLVNPYSGLSHHSAAYRARNREVDLGPPDGPDTVLSAGRVRVDRAARSVRMAERDSHSLGVPSLPGDEDAVWIARVLFPPATPTPPLVTDPLDGTGPALEVPHGQ